MRNQWAQYTQQRLELIFIAQKYFVSIFYFAATGCKCIVVRKKNTQTHDATAAWTRSQNTDPMSTAPLTEESRWEGPNTLTKKILWLLAVVPEGARSRETGEEQSTRGSQLFFSPAVSVLMHLRLAATANIVHRPVPLSVLGCLHSNCPPLCHFMLSLK